MAVLQLTKADVVLKEIESLGKKSFLPIVGPVKGKLLGELVRRHRPHQVLEVGSLVGYSAILMGMNLPQNGEIMTLEINPGMVQVARENIVRAGLANKIRVIGGDAKKTIPRLEGPFQFVFLDAAKSEYMDYLKLVEVKISAGGLVVADNAGIFAREMAPYLEYVRTSGLYKSRFYDFGFDGMEVSYKQG